MKKVLALTAAIALVFGVAGISFAEEDHAEEVRDAASRMIWESVTAWPGGPALPDWDFVFGRSAAAEQPEPEPEVEVMPFNNNEKWQPENELSDSPNWPMP